MKTKLYAKVIITVILCSIITVFIPYNRAYADNSIKWERNLDIASDAYNDVTCNDYLFVAVGENSLIKTSEDGINWTEVCPRISLSCVTWNGKQFVGYMPEKFEGPITGVKISAGGMNWTTLMLDEYEKFGGIKRNGVIYINGAKNQKTLLISDVENQIKEFGPIKNVSDEALNPVSVIWDGGRYIAICLRSLSKNFAEYEYNILTSADGITWSQSEFALSTPICDIIWNDRIYAAVGSNGTILTGTSADIIKVEINNKPVVFDTAPVIVRDRTMIPVRAVAESLGAYVEWNNDGSIIITKADTIIRMKVNSSDAIVNGKYVHMDVPVVMINNRALVPLRFISEAFGAEVSWKGDTRTVIIKLK